MANDQNDKTLIKLDQIDGSFTKLIPPTKATEIYLDNLQHQMRHELTSDGCSYQQIIADVICPNRVNLAKANELACKIASSKLDHALETELPACINVMLNEGKITSISTESVEPEPPYSGPLVVSAWADKAQVLPNGSTAIFNDLTILNAQLRSQMQESTSYHGNKLTLIVPDSHVPFLMAQTGSCDSALAMLKAALPNLELLTVPALKRQEEAYVLLICTSQAYGPACYLSLDGEIHFRAIPHIEHSLYKLHIPAHKLVITNPEQIAVLTGI